MSLSSKHDNISIYIIIVIFEASNPRARNNLFEMTNDDLSKVRIKNSREGVQNPQPCALSISST